MFYARGHQPGSANGRSDVAWAITDRFGTPAQVEQSFTLGGRDPSWATRIANNRAALGAELGVGPGAVRFMRQVHGSQVATVSGSCADADRAPTCDAMVTNDPDIALAVLVADCTPVLLWDAAAGWVGVVHAGRAGLLNGVVSSCLTVLRDHGATDLHAIVGPAICGRCYEVPARMRAEAAAVDPAAHTVSWTGTPAIDVAAAVVSQLREAGVIVHWVPGCTRESSELFSHREDPGAGRFAAVVRLGDLAVETL